MFAKNVTIYVEETIKDIQNQLNSSLNKDGKKSVRFPVFKTLKEEGAVPHNSDMQNPVDYVPKKPELIVEALF